MKSCHILWLSYHWINLLNLRTTVFARRKIVWCSLCVQQYRNKRFGQFTNHQILNAKFLHGDMHSIFIRFSWMQWQVGKVPNNESLLSCVDFSYGRWFKCCVMETSKMYEKCNMSCLQWGSIGSAKLSIRQKF